MEHLPDGGLNSSWNFVFEPSEPLKGENLVLLAGESAREEFIVDFAVGDNITIVARPAEEPRMAWEFMFRANHGAFSLAYEAKIQIVGLSLDHFLFFELVTARGFLLIQMNRSENGSWVGFGLSRGFSKLSA